MPRRRKKLLGPRTETKQRVTVHEDSMDCPNHMAPLRLFPEDVPAKPIDESLYHDFALLHLQKPSGPGSGQPAGVLFVDDRYGLLKWVDRSTQAPPTWMDPEVFIRQVLAKPRAAAIVRRYKERGTSGQRLKLQALLQQVFEEEYLVYLFQQFETAKPLLAEWLKSYLWQQLDAVKKRKVTVRVKRRSPA